MTDEQKASEAENQKASGEDHPVIQAQLQQVRITSFQGLKTALEAMVNAAEYAFPLLLFLLGMLVAGGLLLHEIHDQRRHQRSGKEVGRAQREYHGFSQRHKEKPRHTGKKEHGHKHDADR